MSTVLGDLHRVVLTTKGSRMKRLFALAAVFTSGLILGLYLRGSSQTALAGGGGGVERCAGKNGDVNADGTIDLSDAVTILGNLFLGKPSELAPSCAAAYLPDTGQSTCYDDNGNLIDCASATCGGQDGFYRIGCPPKGRFIDNGDATVTDKCTGLMWQQDTADTNQDGRMDAEDAVSHCSALGYCEHSRLAGHEDWRLPNIRELQSIVDYGSVTPAIDPVFRESASDAYWSSTPYAVAPAYSWHLGFGDGYVLASGNDTSRYVRAVRNTP